MTTPRLPRHSWFGPVEAADTDGSGADTDNDEGRALIEVIFLGVLMLIPIVYILISLLRLQAATFAVTQAARDAGRAIDGAPTVNDGIARAQQIAGIDLADQNVAGNTITLTFVTAGTDCKNGNTITPSLDAGAVYDICVTAVVSLPGVPTVITGSNNTVTGVYTVHIGDLREGK